MLLIDNSLFLSSARDLKYTVYFSLESVEFYSKYCSFTAGGWVRLVILFGLTTKAIYSLELSAAVIIKKFNEFLSIEDHAYYIEE